MTPLAHFMAKDLTLPLKRRCALDAESIDVARRLGDAHCFEVTDALPLIEDLAEKIAYDQHDVGQLGFLPAPKTWIEAVDRFGSRKAFFLESTQDDRSATVTNCQECSDYSREQLQLMAEGKDPGHVRTLYEAMDTGHRLSLFCEDGDKVGWTAPGWVSGYTSDPEEREMLNNWEPGFILAALALINSPRIIGRRQHMPHRGLERKLVAARGLVGKFPLHAWTEIKLSVNAPRDMRDDPSVEAHYTGQRALHFCRAHLRVRLGRLEIVRSHWRGDGSLGIKRSRYKLVASQV